MMSSLTTELQQSGSHMSSRRNGAYQTNWKHHRPKNFLLHGLHNWYSTLYYQNLKTLMMKADVVNATDEFVSSNIKDKAHKTHLCCANVLAEVWPQMKSFMSSTSRLSNSPIGWWDKMLHVFFLCSRIRQCEQRPSWLITSCTPWG